MILNFLELRFLKANLGKMENWWSWCNYDWIRYKWLKSMHKLKENFNVPWRVRAGHFFRKIRNKGTSWKLMKLCVFSTNWCIDDKLKRVEMNLSSGNEYLTYFEFMKLYRVDKKNGVCLRVKLWMMIENELSYFT